MGSKPFVFVTFVFILCLMVVGWYFFEVFANKAPVAATKGFEYALGEDPRASIQQKDFLSWVQGKASALADHIGIKVKK
ncbi:MAG TPA: hypothetical protein PKO44_04400 [Candidatus Omnitrophota bacterium]|nr:hypothetical protein [Candidatus Omnitrophota bacterium]